MVDTGGLTGEKDGVEALMERQARLAIEEADQILLILDAREGCTQATKPSPGNCAAPASR